MVDITPAVSEQRQLIQSYGDGGFRIAGIDYTGSVLIEPEQTHPWPIVDSAAVTFESLAPITRSGRTQSFGGMVMLLGTGAEPAIIHRDLRVELRALGIGLEVMGTGAACRTYNILMTEERRVVAALFPVD